MLSNILFTSKLLPLHKTLRSKAFHRSVEVRPRLLRQATVLTLASLCAALPVMADEEINIKFAHRFAATHYAWTEGGEVFTKEVEKASSGRVTFDVFPAGQLGKDYYSILRSGLADIAVFIPSYESDKLPMSSVVELPGMYSNVCEGTNKYWQLAQAGGALGDSEYKRQGLHVLFVTVMPPYTLMTTKKPTLALDNIKGLKIRGNGAAMIKATQALGAVPVQLSASETYEALARGTVDGAIYPYSSLTPYNLEEHLKYSVEGVSLGGSAVAYAISTRAWNKLPAEIKDIMTQAAASTQASLCAWSDEENLKIKNHIVAKNGHVITELTQEDLTTLQSRMDHVVQDWVKGMDAARRNGSEILQAYLQASAEAE
jgi:TRAP-type C4-dicarboxylate transport system substrate-binding protein